MKIFANHLPLDDNPKTNLTASILAGVTTFGVYNNQGFSATTNLAVIGQYSDEQAEIVKTTSTTRTVFNLSAGTIYAHALDTQVAWLAYDEVEFSRSDDGGISWTILATTAVQVDRPNTLWVDTFGVPASLWRYRFHNTISNTFSSYSTSLSISGYAPYQLEKLQERVINAFSDVNMRLLTYQNLTDWINECSEILADEVFMNDKNGLNSFITGSVTAGGIIVLPDDFVKLKRLSISYNGITFTKATLNDISSPEFGGDETSSLAQFNVGQPQYYRQDNSLYILPNTPITMTYRLWYYRLPTSLSNPQDKLDLIFRPFTSLYVDYCMFRAKWQDKKHTDAQDIFDMFNGNKKRFDQSLSTWQYDEAEHVQDVGYYDDSGVRSPGHLN